MTTTADLEWAVSKTDPGEDDVADVVSFETRTAAILGARLCLYLKPGERFFTMRKGAAQDVQHPTVDTLLDCASDSPGRPDGADPWPNPTTEAAAELEEQLSTMWHAWLEKHGLQPTWWTAEDVQAHVMPSRQRCQPYEGCTGNGAVIDSSDSGSGRQCYCDCIAGEALKAEDRDREAEQEAVNKSHDEALAFFAEKDAAAAEAPPALERDAHCRGVSIECRVVAGRCIIHPARPQEGSVVTGRNQLERAAEDTLDPLCELCKAAAPGPRRGLYVLQPSGKTTCRSCSEERADGG